MKYFISILTILIIAIACYLLCLRSDHTPKWDTVTISGNSYVRSIISRGKIKNTNFIFWTNTVTLDPGSRFDIHGVIDSNLELKNNLKHIELTLYFYNIKNNQLDYSHQYDAKYDFTDDEQLHIYALDTMSSQDIPETLLGNFNLVASFKDNLGNEYSVVFPNFKISYLY